MDTLSAGGGALSLVPADDRSALSATNSDSPATESRGDYSVEATPANESGVERVDRFIAEANREYDKGHVDQPLWTRALAQAGGDAAVAKPAYLRARATALRVMRRDKRSELPEQRARAPGTTGGARGGSDSRDEDSPDEPDGAEPRSAKSSLRYLAMAAATLGSLIVVAWVLFAHKASDAPPTPLVAAAGPAQASSAQAAQLANASANTEREEANQKLAVKVQELKDAANWNVLVLYAAEWTRKEPANSAAWKELSNGYVNLRQFADAQSAAAKAVEVAPKDALLWRNLGRVSLDLDQPEAALRAFEQATMLDDKDADSYVQSGILNARLGHLPEAKLAFAAALAVTPENADALCGDALVAQKQGRPKDAIANARSAKPLDKSCVEMIDGKPAVVAAPSSPAAYKTVRLNGR